MKRKLLFEKLEDRQLLSLSHLYTFNDGSANDWIGSAHGVLENGASVVAGRLVLDNTGVTSGEASSVEHVSLPASVLPVAGDLTIEAWYTASNLAERARLFDFGDRTGDAGSSYLSFMPNSGLDDSRAVLRPAASIERIASGPTTDDGMLHVAAVVVDTSARVLRLYLDGVQVQASALDSAHADSINDTLAYLGRSLFDSDPGFTGSIDELRIYDEARGADAIAADAASGASLAVKSPLVRQMERLDRAMVVVRTSATEAYVGWRLLGTDPPDITFNLYRTAGGGAPVKLNTQPLTQTTDFADSADSTGLDISVSNSYFVRPIIDGIEQEASKSFVLPSASPEQQYLSVPLERPPGGEVDGQSFFYRANDASVGDVDGDGQFEIVLQCTRQFASWLHRRRVDRRL